MTTTRPTTAASEPALRTSQARPLTPSPRAPPSAAGVAEHRRYLVSVRAPQPQWELYSSSVTCSPQPASGRPSPGLGDGQVGHEVVGCSAVPAPLLGRRVDDVAGRGSPRPVSYTHL